MGMTSDKKALFAVMLGFSILFALGCWQIKRLERKELLIATSDERLSRPPVTMPVTFKNITNWQYRRVVLYGSFVHKKEFLVGPRTLDGVPGYHLVTPFEVTPENVTVMINRGFVDDAHLTSVYRPEGKMKLDGTMVLAQQGTYTPDNDIAARQWYWIDPGAMAYAADISNVSPLVVVAEPSKDDGAWPKPVPARPVFRNDHKQYAIFWFTMAFILLGFYIVWRRSLMKEKKHAGV